MDILYKNLTFYRESFSIITAGLLICSCIYKDMSDCPNYNGNALHCQGKGGETTYRMAITLTTKAYYYG